MDSDRETLFYSDNRGVRITSKQIVVGEKSYPMHNINTVAFSKTPPNRAGALWCVALSLGVGALGIPTQLWLAVLGGMALAGLCLWWMVSIKPRYSAVIGGFSGTFHAVTSRDEKYIKSVVHAIDDAFGQMSGRLS